MTKEVFTYFAKMFEADRDMPEGKWFAQFPMYKHDAVMGGKLWWPALSEVWLHGETCPYAYRNAATDSWGEAWALLQRLHDEYRTAKQQRRKAHEVSTL